MHIPLDRQSVVPLYQQIERHLRQAILRGSLAAGARLPASRQLARDLGLNRLTVESAYASLAADGLVVARVGSGTYVLAPTPAAPIPPSDPDISWPLWQQEPRISTGRLQTTWAEEVRGAADHPRLIDFTGGIGDSRLFPVEDFRKALQAVLRRDGTQALEYGEPHGYPPLRSTIAQILAGQGLALRPENILIASGSQQALAMVAQILLKPGDPVLVESPTYAGALDLFSSLGFKIVGIHLDENGMQVEHLERLLQQHHPKLIYTIPNYHNPTGVCLSAPRRRQLLTLADRYNVPILEDDFVGDLRYEGHAQPALKAFDPGGRVIYVSTFSKMLMPGMRVGFLAVEGPIYESLAQYKRVSDLASSNLMQRALEAYVTVGRYQAHLHRCCQLYRKRRDAILAALRRCLPAGASFDTPQGGLFIWLRLPDPLSSADLLPLARREGVSYAAGSAFFLDRAQGDRYLRLNFVTHRLEEIEEGIKRLGKAIRQFMTQTVKE